MGRKAILDVNPEITKRLCEILSLGNYIEAACAYVGISETSYYAWVQRGEKDLKAGKESSFTEFVKATKKARAEAEVVSVARIRDAASSGEWQADAWFLERSFPDRWGRRRQDLHVDSNQPAVIINIDI
jgi:hypothetical protein